MNLINPSTGQAFDQKKLTDTQIMQAFQALQAKIDALANQSFNGALLVEFLIEKLNSYVNEKGDLPLQISTDEFEAFFKARVEEIRVEMQDQVAQSVNAIGQQTPKAEASV